MPPTQKPTLEDRVEVATVVHRTRVALAFGAFVVLLLRLAFWLTDTPRRWRTALALAFGIGAAVGIYAALR